MKKRYLDELHEYFNYKSTMEILGVDRDENAHSKFLAWLFEKPRALSLLLKFIKGQHKKEIVPIIENYYKIVSITEDFFMDNGEKRRADILIKVYPKVEDEPYYIVIENKVYSDEHTNQLCAYFNHYSQKYGEGRVLFLFLTLPEKLRRSRQKKTEHVCDKFIPITYQNVMSNVLDKIDQDVFIQDYVKCLELSYWQEKKAMAYSKSLVSLLNKFWQENKTLIRLFSNVDVGYPNNLVKVWNEHSLFLRTSIKAMAGMTMDMFADIDNGDYELICKLNDIVNGKDFTQYVIKESSGDKSKPLCKNELIFDLVTKYVERTETTFERLQNDFSETWRMNPNSRFGTLTNQIVINKKRYEEDVKDKKDWKELENMKGVYVLQTLWDGKELMRKVINNVGEIEVLKDLTIIEQEDIKTIHSRLGNK